jgi:hypothetical protein
MVDEADGFQGHRQGRPLPRVQHRPRLRPAARPGPLLDGLCHWRPRPGPRWYSLKEPPLEPGSRIRELRLVDGAVTAEIVAVKDKEALHAAQQQQPLPTLQAMVQEGATMHHCLGTLMDQRQRAQQGDAPRRFRADATSQSRWCVSRSGHRRGETHPHRDTVDNHMRRQRLAVPPPSPR